MSRPTQPTSESAHTEQLARVRKSLKQHRDNREILVQCLKATDILIEQTHDEYERLLRNFQANNSKSYIDALPNEVLMEIFKAVCEGTSNFYTRDMAKHHLRRSPIVISLVSSRWRAVSLEQRELWRAFGARLDQGRNATNASQRSLFRTFLRRSNGLPMDLWFASTVLNLEAGPTVLQDALSCPHRVRRLAIFFEAGSANRTVECLIKSDWPYIETLEIYVGRQAERFDLPATTINGGEGLAQLTQLRSNTDFFMHIPQRNLSQLTTIQMERCFRPSVTKYPWSFLLNLARIPTLIEFSIVGDLFRNPANAVQEPVVAKNLKYFRCSDEIVAQRMWTDIAFPKLQLLVLQTVNLGTQRFPYNVEEYRTQQQVQSVLAPNLRTLVLVECTAGLGPVSRRFLGFATAPITRLVIVDQKVQTDNVFERLVSNSHHTYWPNLEVITYKGNPDEDTPISSPAYLLEFLEDQKTKKPCKLRLCVDQDLLEERESQGNSEDWEKLEDSGRFESVRWEEDVIPWPRRNFFSNQSQVAFNL